MEARVERELPALDATAEERQRAERDTSECFQRLGHRILCRERQLLTSLAESATLHETISALRADGTKAAEELASVKDVLRESAWNHGAVHEDDCPADDTCYCKWKPFNDRVNKACGQIAPNDLSFMARANAAEEKLSHYPAIWREDSSLKTWFPFTAEEIDRLRAELARERERHQELREVATKAEQLFRLIRFKYGTLTPKMSRWVQEWLDSSNALLEPKPAPVATNAGEEN
jgi:type II secretory pathway component PulM